MRHQTSLKTSFSQNSILLGRLPRRLDAPCRKTIRLASSIRVRACSYFENISADLAARLKYQKSKGALPNLELSHIQAVERQLQVGEYLQHEQRQSIWLVVPRSSVFAWPRGEDLTSSWIRVLLWQAICRFWKTIIIPTLTTESKHSIGKP